MVSHQSHNINREPDSVTDDTAAVPRRIMTPHEAQHEAERIAAQCIAESPGDIATALSRMFEKLPKEVQVVIAKYLLRNTFRDMLHVQSWKSKSATYRDRPEPTKAQPKPPAVRPSTVVAEVARQSLLATYRIGGRVLGEIRGEEIPALLEREEGKALTHAFNSLLLRNLRDRTPAGKSVADSVSDQEISGLFESIRSRSEAERIV